MDFLNNLKTRAQAVVLTLLYPFIFIAALVAAWWDAFKEDPFTIGLFTFVGCFFIVWFIIFFGSMFLGIFYILPHGLNILQNVDKLIEALN